MEQSRIKAESEKKTHPPKTEHVPQVVNLSCYTTQVSHFEHKLSTIILLYFKFQFNLFIVQLIHQSIGIVELLCFFIIL